jgi:curli production assembly/transport component CsgF
MKPFVWILAGCALASGVHASELVYTPINPTFGGNPLNASQLQYTATAQKPNPPAAKTASTQQSTEQQFLQMLQSQLYASLANAVSNAITGSNAQAAGTIKLDNMQVSWNTINGQKQITMTDYSTGQVTTIVLPSVGS